MPFNDPGAAEAGDDPPALGEESATGGGAEVLPPMTANAAYAPANSTTRPPAMIQSQFLPRIAMGASQSEGR